MPRHPHAELEGSDQAVSSGATRKPPSVMTTALAAATKIDGMSRGNPRVVRSRMVVNISVVSAR